MIQQKLWIEGKKMVIKSKIYIAGPRMGQNNSMYGIEIGKTPKKAKASKVNKSKSRKKNKQENTMAMKKSAKKSAKPAAKAPMKKSGKKAGTGMDMTPAQKKLPPFIQAAIDKKKKKK